jgi:hypothetical protein
MCVNNDGTHFTIAASMGGEEMPVVVAGLVGLCAPFREYSDCIQVCTALAPLAWFGSQSSSKTIGETVCMAE